MLRKWHEHRGEIACARHFKGLDAVLERPPKIIEIDGDGPARRTRTPVGGGDEGRGPRIERVRLATHHSPLRAATFTVDRGWTCFEWWHKLRITITFCKALQGSERRARAAGRSSRLTGRPYNGRDEVGSGEGHGPRIERVRVSIKASNIYRELLRRKWRGTHCEDCQRRRLLGDGRRIRKEARHVSVCRRRVYEGEWKRDEKEGRGTYRSASGNV